MQQYLDVCRKALAGQFKENRTGVPTVGYTGDMMKFDLSKGFPVVTTKKFAFKACIAEMLCFLRGYTNASSFRAIGCKVWDDNANKNETWLANPFREGKDDLGPIYGKQARAWQTYGGQHIDQLERVYLALLAGDDDRRLIVSHWNVGELEKMALVPCHALYKFSLWDNQLHMTMWQRSCDLPLGVPFNITGYAWLLSVMAHITNYDVGTFTWFGDDIHIYKNQIDAMENVQLKRAPHKLPNLEINPTILDLRDLETWVTPNDFELIGYTHDEAITYPFSV